MYRKLQKLGNDNVKDLLKELNIKPHKHYAKNVSELHNFLLEIDYKGKIDLNSIYNRIRKLQEFMVPTGENTYADYIMANDLFKQESKDKNKKVKMFYNKFNDFVNTIDNTPLPEERWNLRNNKFLEKSNARTFVVDFDQYSNANRSAIVKQMYKKFWTPFMEKITIEQKWIIKYYTNNGCYTASIRADDIDKLKQYLDNQNWDTHIEEDESTESDSIIKVRFTKINRIELIDYTPYPTLEKPKIKRGLKNKIADIPGATIGKSYGKRTGRFWKWTLKLPRDILNLERYQIFNTLNENTVKIMAKEHCLVYALKQYGIPENITEDIKTYLTHSHLPMSKLSEISEISGIEFNVRYYKDITTDPKYNSFKPSTKPLYTVDLILYENHYMLDEEINFNLPYINLRKQMSENPLNTTDWTLEEKLRVEKCVKNQHGNMCYKKINSKKVPTCSLPRLLKALFTNGYFKPITMNDYLVYYSSLYKESLEESSIITINEHDTRLIKDSSEEAMNKDILKTKEFIGNLDPDDYPLNEIYLDHVSTIKSDPSNKHTLTMIDDEIVDVIKPRKVKPSCIIYADFECSTNGDKHKEYCICADKTDLNNYIVDHFESFNKYCAIDFLNWCDDNALIYFHNLSYDMNFLLKHFDSVKGNPIIFNGRDMSYKVIYNKKTLTLRDSYALISSKLEQFPSMFKLNTGVKEAFPYDYYTSERVLEGIGNINDALEYVKPSLKQQFLNNIETLNVKIDDETFDMKKYALFYCNQDVRILREGFGKFRTDMLEALDLDCIESLSISSVADKYFKREIYCKNGNLYEVSGVLQKNLSKCVQGGRCMTRDNEKQINEDIDHTICDFDAVSLYPSAIRRLYNLEGKPHVIPREWNGDYIIKHLFDEDQLKPTSQKFISGFFVKIHIDEIGIKRHFPLIVFNPALNPDMDPKIKRSSNTCCNMWLDHITLVDLIKFQKIKFTLLGGYYYNNNRNTQCRNVIQKLFELRLKYKKEDNPLQQVIKLILNSIYGKTILKPIEHKHVFIKNENSENYLKRNFNEVVESFEVNNGYLTRFKVIKPINKHYNFAPFGINILSMSKRIMNEVFCLAEDMGLTVFYQDTDSGHYYVDEIEKLAQEYKKIYNRDLIGKNLGQFHSDFANVSKDGDMPNAVKSIFLGKKSYIDMLVDNTGALGFHARMKGVTSNAIVNTANEMFPDAIPVEFKDGLYYPLKNEGVESSYSIYELYKALYNGDEVAFDLVDKYNPRFQMNKDKTISSKNSFIRKVKFV